MKQECGAGKTGGCRDSEASDKQGDGRHWAERRGEEERKKEEKMSDS